MNDPQEPPRFPVGGPTTTSWKEHALSRARELRQVAEWIRVTDGRPEVGPTLESVDDHLRAANEAADPSNRMRGLRAIKASIVGAAVERAHSNLDAAEYEVLGVAPLDYVRGQLHNLLAHVRAHLPADDDRRRRVEQIAGNTTRRFGEVERGAVVAAVRMASVESRREVTRVRSFRNILWVSAALLTAVVVALVVIGVVKPDALPLCFNPGDEVVCPTEVAEVSGAGSDQPTVAQADPVIRTTAGPWDIPVVVLVGTIAAAVAAAASLKDIKGTSVPYSLPSALAVLKLPTGALTAFLGLLLMRGEFIPGLSALDSPGQILAWAIVFGYAQQLLTGLVDKQAQGVLDEVGKPNQPPANEPEAAPPAALAPPAAQI